jgi:hypothetical protein
MFWRLLLAHFLADYPLQPDWLVARKANVWAVGLHVSIHGITSLILLGVGRSQVWLPLLVLVGIHFSMDWFRIHMTSFWAQRKKVAYVIDQILHVVVIAFIATWAARRVGSEAPFAIERWPIYATGLLLATYVWFISERIFNAQDRRYVALLNAQLWPRMLVRGTLFALVVAAGTLFSPGPAALALGVPYRSKDFGRKTLLTDLAVSVVTAVVVLLIVP